MGPQKGRIMDSSSDEQAEDQETFIEIIKDDEE
jgi:hypothetical protein